jgi:hypothetical protein
VNVRKLGLLAPIALIPLLLSGCGPKLGDIEQGGIRQIRSACPAVAIPAGTGDITLFDPPASTSASAIDVTAILTNVRSTCDETGEQVVTTITFDVQARRTRTDSPRSVTLPYFTTVVQGGSAVIAKRVGQVTLNFAAGESRATAQGQGQANVLRSAATLPKDIRDQITRRRKAGDEDAATDPLARPEIRQAVLRSSFEALVGFQLTDAQLKYNATR